MPFPDTSSPRGSRCGGGGRRRRPDRTSFIVPARWILLTLGCVLLLAIGQSATLRQFNI
jgi:hypothetical protein